jgi:hypothetical protein
MDEKKAKELINFYTAGGGTPPEKPVEPDTVDLSTSQIGKKESKPLEEVSRWPKSKLVLGNQEAVLCQALQAPIRFREFQEVIKQRDIKARFYKTFLGSFEQFGELSYQRLVEDGIFKIVRNSEQGDDCGALESKHTLNKEGGYKAVKIG